ncbi:hypothetical protein ABS71_01715 [bacterium SCN 62-11]|nr:hypothetical protein [Candidatus Eremiobacteraeota bacterium]ODT78590.1 MAG: hypothetical protein ABS71_01715 [bacterium SCN 62-11]
MSSFQCGLLFYVREGPDRGRTFALEHRELTLGRARTAGDRAPGWVLLNDPAVGRIHAEMAWDDSVKAYHLVWRSETPVLVNGTEITDKVIRVGDQIKLGSTTIDLMTAAAVAAANAETQKIKIPSPSEVKAKPVIVLNRTLEILSGAESGEVLPLRGNKIQVGGPETSGVPEDRTWWDQDVILQDKGFPYRCMSWSWVEAERGYQVSMLRPVEVSISFERSSDGMDWMSEMPSGQGAFVVCRDGDRIIVGKTALQLRISEPE